MTKANINKIVLTMVKEMYYSADIMHVGKSEISHEYRDYNEVGKLGECFTLNEGAWHIEYDEDSHDIWFWKTKYNSDNKAVGYIPKYSVDTNGKTQIEICAELGYWLMQIRINEIK